jgi:hypothetical protein
VCGSGDDHLEMQAADANLNPVHGSLENGKIMVSDIENDPTRVTDTNVQLQIDSRNPEDSGKKKNGIHIGDVEIHNCGDCIFYCFLFWCFQIICPCPTCSDNEQKPNILSLLYDIIFDLFDILLDGYFCFFIANGILQITSIIFFVISVILYFYLLVISYKKITPSSSQQTKLNFERIKSSVYEFALALTLKHLGDSWDEEQYEDTFRIKMLIVLFEDIPQFIIQLIFTTHDSSSSSEDDDNNQINNLLVILSICISCRSILSKFAYLIAFSCGMH